MSQLSVAMESDFKIVKSFYWELIDQMQGSPFLPGWEKGIYPTDDFIQTSLKNKELFVLKQNEKIVAAAVLNHECNEGYTGTNWAVNADIKEILIVHALGVLPSFQGRGLAKCMINDIIKIAKDRKQKVIRLDVLNGNTPAMKLYENMGFKYRKTTQMYYEDTGWTEFLLYEFVL